jgi:PPK2 family polyphosphate:nucleotide phosphotransferase
MNYVWKVVAGSKVNLRDYDPGYTEKHSDRASADLELRALSDELGELQELLAAAQDHSLLVVLQGMDTSGKDGTIRHVLSHVNPQGCDVYSFKVPTQEELAHDFLWRVHKVTPGKGIVGIFNRSHYEDVLVARVHNLVPEKVWSRRYQEINDFEQLLTENGMIILKFYLHISYDEQERRLLARGQDKDKAWKLSAEDWEDRKYWKDYEQAYEDVLSKCSTDKAPWHIVPANHKWYRNLAVAHTVVHTMRQFKDEWKAALEERGQRELEKLKRMRSAGG